MIDIINTIFFPIMWGPTIWEVANDWTKDTNRKADVVVRALLMTVAAGTYGLVQYVVQDRDVQVFWVFSFRGAAMTLACFVFVFDYAMAARFAPDRDWFSYGAPDKWVDQKVAVIPPVWRFAIRIVVFSLASVWYW